MPLPLLALGLTGLGLKNLNDKVTEDRAAGRQKAADQAEQRSAVADVEPVIKEAAGGMGPTAVMVGKKAYGTEQEAGKAAEAYNSPDAKIARLQGVMLNQANPDGAMKLEKNALDMRAYRQKVAKAMEDEGIVSFIDTNIGAAPQVADIEAGKAGLFDLRGVPEFNKTGGNVTVPDGAKGRWKVMDYGNGRKEADFEVIGPDGKVLEQSARTLQHIHAMSVHDREKMADDRTDKAQTQKDRQADNARLDKQLQGQLDYWKSMADKAERWQPGGSGGSGGSSGGRGGSAFERMKQEDLEAFKSATRQIEKIQQGIIDATAGQTWAPEKDPSQRALLLQKDQLEKQAQAILARYGDQSAPAAGRPDTFGIRAAIDEQAPPSFDVRGDPAAFRRQLVAKGNAAALEAFDKQFPQVARKPEAKPVASRGIQAAPQEKPKPDGGPGIIDRIASTLGAIMPKANWDAHAQAALQSGDKQQMRMLVAKGSESESAISPQIKAKLQAAISR